MTGKMIDEPMRELMVTMSAWRRLYAEAKELESNNNLVGTMLLYYMGEAWDEAEKDLKKGEKKLEKQVRKEAKE